jgi:hypothetical protein
MSQAIVLRLALQYVQDISACNASAKETIMIDFAHMGDFVPNRRDLANGIHQSMLWILYATESATRLLLDAVGEQNRG